MQRPLLTNTSLCSDNCAMAALQTHLSRTAPWQDTPDIMNKKQLKTGPAGINPAGPVCFFRNAETDAGRHQKRTDCPPHQNHISDLSYMRGDVVLHSPFCLGNKLFSVLRAYGFINIRCLAADRLAVYGTARSAVN